MVGLASESMMFFVIDVPDILQENICFGYNYFNLRPGSIPIGFHCGAALIDKDNLFKYKGLTGAPAKFMHPRL